MNNLAPIVLFVYNRPTHTKRVLESLIINKLAAESTLYIFADGAKNGATEEQLQEIKKVRELIRSDQWCKEVYIIESDSNKGLVNSVIDGITYVINKWGKVIVLEDDLILSKGFLQYMNNALELYEQDKKVMHISGFMEPIYRQLPETFFLPLATCWGWATWQRAWGKLSRSSEELLEQVKKIGVADFNMGIPHYEMLKESRINPYSSWAILWHASVYINEGLCLHPRMSLVRNIGHDGSGEHCGNSKIYNNQKIIDHITVYRIPLTVSKIAKTTIVNSFVPQGNLPMDFTRRIVHEFKKIFPVRVKDAIKSKVFKKNNRIDWNEYTELLEEWGKDNAWIEVSGFFKNKSGRVLDIGCGNGALMEIILKNGNLSVYGCDISEGLIESAKKRNGINAAHLKVCSATDMKMYNDAFFDYTYSIGLLHYLTDNELDKAVAQIFRITKNKSLHLVPVSINNKNYGWTTSWQRFQNNSLEWWLVCFKKYYTKIDIIDSAWSDEWSTGKWIVCIK